jgi:hypothetical protein
MDQRGGAARAVERLVGPFAFYVRQHAAAQIRFLAAQVVRQLLRQRVNMLLVSGDADGEFVAHSFERRACPRRGLEGVQLHDRHAPILFGLHRIGCVWRRTLFFCETQCGVQQGGEASVLCHRPSPSRPLT